MDTSFGMISVTGKGNLMSPTLTMEEGTTWIAAAGLLVLRKAVLKANREKLGFGFQ